MTDKQIIIDGVDVSGCEWYFSTYFKPCGGCKNTPDCHYKNWQRKEQECEELKEKNIGLNKDWEEKKNLAYEITCKNEKLKQTLTEIKEIAQYDAYTPHTDLCIKLNWVKKKISEVENG